MHRILRSGLWLASASLGAWPAVPANAQPVPEVKPAAPEPPPGTILQAGENPIDLGSALRLAGAENPELLLARQRVQEALAVRQLASVQFLPNLNLGTNYDAHTGVLQQSNGTILKLSREAAYVGLGSNAIGGGTVNIPGLNLNVNIGVAWYGVLAARQRVQTVSAVRAAVTNDVLLRVCLAYYDLIRGEARRAIAASNRTEAAEIARLTDVYAKAGQGKQSDADRAAVELKRREVELTQAEAEQLTASARLCQLLNLDPSTRLKPVEGWAIPTPIIPAPMALPELLAVALMQRPELAARRSDVQQALFELAAARVLPFSPNVILGFSAGGFGGGSSIVQAAGTGPRFSNLAGRADFDAVVVWTFRNLGLGNLALVRIGESRARQGQLRELESVNAIRSEVAEAHARVTARLRQIDSAEQAVRASADAYRQDLARIKGGQGLPLEVVDSLRLLSRSRYEYLDSIVDYNRAQVQLWVAIGQPPADPLFRSTQPEPADQLHVPVGPRVFPIPQVLQLKP